MVRDVVDVDRVDADECRIVVSEPGGARPGEEARVRRVLRRAEPRAIAGVQQHRFPADVKDGEGANADVPLPRAGHPDDDGRQADGAGQRNGSQVRG